MHVLLDLTSDAQHTTVAISNVLLVAMADSYTHLLARQKKLIYGLLSPPAWNSKNLATFIFHYLLHVLYYLSHAEQSYCAAVLLRLYMHLPFSLVHDNYSRGYLLSVYIYIYIKQDIMV